MIPGPSVVFGLTTGAWESLEPYMGGLCEAIGSRESGLVVNKPEKDQRVVV